MTIKEIEDIVKLYRQEIVKIQHKKFVDKTMICWHKSLGRCDCKNNDFCPAINSGYDCSDFYDKNIDYFDEQKAANDFRKKVIKIITKK